MQSNAYSPNVAYLRTVEAAAHIRLGKSSLEKLRLSGEGPPYMKIGRTVLYAITDLESWLAEHKRSSTSEVADAGGM